MLALVESLIFPGNVTLPAVVLGGAVGVALGSLVGLLQAGLYARPRPWQLASWGAFGAAAGLWVALQVGAFAKLRGQHPRLALVALLTCGLGGGGVGLLLHLVQPTAGERLPFLRPGVARGSFAVLAAVALLGSEISAERLLVLRGYPAARAALLVATWLFVGAAATTFGAPAVKLARRVRVTTIGAYSLLLLGLAAAARLTPEEAERLFERPHSGAFLALARAASDFDGDGASGWFAGGDCAAFDAKIGPRSAEVPGNGVDDNCRWGDAAPAPRSEPTGTSPASPSPLSVLLVTIDTLRADHVGAYGYPRPTTPNLDRFAARARRFSHAYTSGGWTCLAIHSLFSGLYPRRLSWEPVALTVEQQIVPFPWQAHLAAGDAYMNTISALAKSPVPPFPILLRARGMRTGAALAGAAPARLFRYKRWLEESFDAVVTTEQDHDDGLTDAALGLFEGFGQQRFFLWVHYFEPHFPFRSQHEAPDFGDELIDRYDHDVAFTDHELGRLLERVQRERPDTAVIVTADHGESFEGGTPSHGLDLSEELIHVPLVIGAPGLTPAVVEEPASLVDLVPTILAWTATPRQAVLDGVDLLEPLSKQRVVLTDLWHRHQNGRLHLDLVAATGQSGRLLHDRLRQTWLSSTLGRTDTRAPSAPDPVLERALGNYLEQPAGVEEPP